VVCDHGAGGKLRETHRLLKCGPTSTQRGSGSGPYWTCVGTILPAKSWVQTRWCRQCSRGVHPIGRHGMDGRVPSCRNCGAELPRLAKRGLFASTLESGRVEHCVQRFLDHANLSTTSRYLKTTRRGMHEALTRVEERRTRCTAVAHEVDSALTLTKHPTGPGIVEVSVSKALPGQPLTN